MCFCIPVKGPQGMFAGEHIVRHVAHVLGKDVTEISKQRLTQKQIN